MEAKLIFNWIVFHGLHSIVNGGLQDCSGDRQVNKGQCHEYDRAHGTYDNKYSNLPLCETRHLGKFQLDTIERQLPDIDLLMMDSNIVRGGEWKPDDCVPKQKIAVVVPYRDRLEHLQVFLPNIHRFLQAQNLHYKIFLAEQESDGKHFNRGAIKNAGFLEAIKSDTFDCVIFQDVDKIPEDPRNSYTCSSRPKLLIGKSRYMNGRDYKEPAYKTFFGGVVSMTPGEFENINGYSNQFWGWGSEDDDLFNRVIDQGYEIENVPPAIGKFAEIWHDYETVNPKRYELLEEGKALYATEGLNSIDYRLLSKGLHYLYTNITIRLRLIDTFPADDVHLS